MSAPKRRINYWLLKSDPETFGWSEMQKMGTDHWDGVRNYQARNNLNAMKPGDLALFYHSGKDRQIVGIVEVVSEPYQDPTTDDTRWVVVDVNAVRSLASPVSLAAIKEVKSLADIALIRQSRLSIMPLKKQEFDRILKMEKG